jgi:hypothetical protein
MEVSYAAHLEDLDAPDASSGSACPSSVSEISTRIPGRADLDWPVMSGLQMCRRLMILTRDISLTPALDHFLAAITAQLPD